MTMHQNYIYILHFYYNFRLQLINDAIIKVDCNMDDENMVNVAADIEEARDLTPMSGPRGRRNNKNQDRPVIGQRYW